MDDYCYDLIDPNRISSAGSIDEEFEKQKRIEKGRLNLLLNSPLILELKKQTDLSSKIISQQKEQIQELQKQVELLTTSEKESKIRAKKSRIGFIITTTIALASLVVAIVSIIV